MKKILSLLFCFAVFTTINAATYLRTEPAAVQATKGGGSFFGKVGSFEPGYAFDALVVDDSDLNFDNYSIQHRLERYIYLGDDRQLTRRFCQGKEISAPRID